jgi:hypothetical protein
MKLGRVRGLRMLVVAALAGVMAQTLLPVAAQTLPAAATTLPAAAPVWVDAHSAAADPARDLSLGPEPARALLPEQYIWTAGDAAAVVDGVRYVHHDAMEKIAPHYFRASFEVAEVPRKATLYVAGPRRARIFLNGRLVREVECHPPSWLTFETFVVDVSGFVHAGRNVIAIEAVRGWSHSHHTNLLRTKQLNMGEVLAVKILPAGPAEEALPLLISAADWRSTLDAGEGWQQAEFDDRSWPRVQSLGGIESSTEFYQWHADAGLINWPGYIGVSSGMRRYRMLPERVTVQTEGGVRFEGIENLTTLRAPTVAQSARVLFQASGETVSGERQTPALLLDFGREVAGRVLLESGGDRLAAVEVRYGESMEELLNGPFLGAQTLLLPPHGVARGVKSAFRYVLLSFPAGTAAAVPGSALAGSDEVRLRQASLEGIAYPVRYEASFESSDARLNRIWETAAYTAHLCMQEGVWDGAKRDRGKWMGDMDVTARVIDAVFADGALSEQTFRELAGQAPFDEHVNTIAPYTAFWVIGEAAHFRRTGSLAALEPVRAPLQGLLARMDRDVDAAGLFVNPGAQELFVDWAPMFDRDTPEARRAIQFEYLLAFADGAELLERLGEPALAARYRERSEQMRRAAEEKLLDAATGTYGSLWQANAMAVVSGAASAERGRAIYARVLSEVGSEKMQQVTPFYGYYVMEALARLGHTRQALDWMRLYWGGMLDEGATSFWEAYDPRWPRTEPHKYLEADRKTGYYVSLAHGWSSGPALWLLENVLGLRGEEPGGHSFVVRPELAGLGWARGGMKAGQGKLTVDIKNTDVYSVTVSVPENCRVRVEIPAPGRGDSVTLNGRRYAVGEADTGGRVPVVLPGAGRYEIEVRKGLKVDR